MLSREQIAVLKKKLMQIRAEILSGFDHVSKHANDEFQSDVPDLHDEASRTYNRQVMLSVGEVDRQQIKLIDEALEAMEEGKYGMCSDCEESIPYERLESVPYAKLCIECKTKLEERHKAEQ